jgi:two-component sensor histidine kinase
MNSLQTISALFRLQSRTVQPPEAAAQFEQAVRRIDAIALAYKRMHAADGVESVEFASFMAALCRDLEASLMSTSCIVRAEPLHLSASQAIPLSLILNELVTNAVKHGSDGAEPIVVELKSGGDLCRLAVHSAGSLPEERRAATHGFGMKMVSTMVEQLHGKLEVTSQNGRTEFAVTFRPAALDATV